MAARGPQILPTSNVWGVDAAVRHVLWFSVLQASMVDLLTEMLLIWRPGFLADQRVKQRCPLWVCHELGGATHDVRRSPTSSHLPDVTSSSPTRDVDCDCDCVLSDTTGGSNTPTSVTSSRGGAAAGGAGYRQRQSTPPLQHTLLAAARQQRKKRSRAAFSHAQVNTHCLNKICLIIKFS